MSTPIGPRAQPVQRSAGSHLGYAAVLGALGTIALLVILPGLAARTATITCAREEAGSLCRTEHRRLFLEERVEVDVADDSRIDVSISEPPGGGTSFPRVSLGAEVGEERYQFGARVHVYRVDARPLIGSWSRFASVSCDGAWTMSDRKSSLVFGADGRFDVTLSPSCAGYTDYWGSYEHDLGSGSLSMRVDGGNQIPSNFQGMGLAKVQRAPSADGVDLLYLERVSLGEGITTAPPVCKLVLRRGSRVGQGRP